MERRQIDVAVLTAGVFAESVRRKLSGQAPAPYEYLATQGFSAAVSPFASQRRREPRIHFDYESVCLVAADSAIESVEDIRRLSTANQLEFVFVHPMSLSGRIAPEAALNRLGIDAHPRRYSHSHTVSLRSLANSSRAKERVAFVWDDALRSDDGGVDQRLAKRVRRVALPELDRKPLPQIAVVGRRELAALPQLRTLILQQEDEQGRRLFDRAEDWRQRYHEIRTWCDHLGLALSDEQTQSVSLDEIGQMLLHSATNQAAPPRLALVLSGGGAKCSYQVGAVAALEEKLTALRRQHPHFDLDIELVVGTSGGAINSIPIALGVSSTPQGREEFREVWTRLDQRAIVRPSMIVRWSIGLWFVLVLTLLIVWLGQRLLVDARSRAGRLAALSALMILICIGGTLLNPWRWLGDNHALHHLWLWLHFGFVPAAWCWLAVTVCAVLWQWCLTPRNIAFPAPSRFVLWAFGAALFALPVASAAIMLFFQSSLFDGEGMERTLADNLPVLVESHWRRQGLQTAPIDDDSPRKKLQAFSSQVMASGRLRRDLVITGNCLEQSRGDLPSDLYFYAAANDGRAPSFGRRAVSPSRFASTLRY